jgi:hypothetical protein
VVVQDRQPSSAVWLAIRLTLPHPPRFFVSVASKGFRLGVSGLESTLAGVHVSVASKEVVRSKMAQNTVCSVNVADRGLRPKRLASESKNASRDAGVPGLRIDYYPSNTIRWEILFVKGKSQKTWGWGRNGGGKVKTRSL